MSFEALSIKPSMPVPEGRQAESGPTGGPGKRNPERFTCDRCTLSYLVKLAFELKSYQLTAPQWSDITPFNLIAKVPPGATRRQFREMLQAAILDRFELSYHRARKGMDVYELSVDRNTLRLKPVPAKAPVAPAIQNDSSKGWALASDGFPSFAANIPIMNFNGRTRIFLPGSSMAQFISLLSDQLNRPVVDATELKENYDFRVYWSPTQGLGTGSPVAADPEVASEPVGADLRPVIDAVQRQLGLRVRKKKGTVDLFIIDRAKCMPTAN